MVQHIVDMHGAGVRNLYIMAFQTFVGPDVELRAFRDELNEEFGNDHVEITCDLSNTIQVEELVPAAVDTFGGLDILVNNAGITLEKKTVDVTDEEWETLLATNLTAMFRLARAVAPGMLERRRGKIINVGSMYGVIGVPRYAAYCASKAGVEGLTRSLGVEWARHGIQVNCVAPGYMNTDIPRAALADPKTRELFLSRIPARRIGEPEDIGPLVVYLASPASDYMTGQTVYLDGGQTVAW